MGIGNWSCFCKTNGINSIKRFWSAIVDEVEDNWADSRISRITRPIKQSRINSVNFLRQNND